MLLAARVIDVVRLDWRKLRQFLCIVNGRRKSGGVVGWLAASEAGGVAGEFGTGAQPVDAHSGPTRPVRLADCKFVRQSSAGRCGQPWQFADSHGFVRAARRFVSGARAVLDSRGVFGEESSVRRCASS